MSDDYVCTARVWELSVRVLVRVPVRAYALVRARYDYVCTARVYVPPVKACDTPERVGGSERGCVSVRERVQEPACPSVERKEPSAENPKDPQHKLKERASDQPRKAPRDRSPIPATKPDQKPRKEAPRHEKRNLAKS